MQGGRVERLAIFHHDPTRSDAALDAIEREAQSASPRLRRPRWNEVGIIEQRSTTKKISSPGLSGGTHCADHPSSEHVAR